MQTIDIRIWTSDVWVLCFVETRRMYWPFSYIRHNIMLLVAKHGSIKDFKASLDYYCDHDDPGACFFDLADALVLA